MIIKPIGEEISVTSANTVGGAKLVRVYANGVSKITITDPDTSTVVGSFTVSAGSTTIVEKAGTHTIAGTTALLCAPVSYKS